MTSDEILRLIALPLPALRRKARVPFRTLPSIPAVLDDMADAILAEVRAGSRKGRPVRLILPVGPAVLPNRETRPSRTGAPAAS